MVNGKLSFMFDAIKTVLKTQNILSHLNHGIVVCTVENASKGINLATQILYRIVDTKTILYLSGGRTPRDLYELLGKEEKIIPGASGMVDERFGPKFHPNSNEKMIQETGFLRYLQMRGIPFYPILTAKIDRGETAIGYDEQFRSLNGTFPKSIGILGIGLDGHTAGIAGNRSDFTNPLFSEMPKFSLVSEFDDKNGMFKERVTMTFLGLSMLDLLLVLVFGDDKKNALELLFSEGREEEIPGRFYKRKDISKKTLLITDQRV